MSKWAKDYERYVERYAHCYCNGDKEVAETHAIVKEAKKQYEQISETKVDWEIAKTFKKL